MRNCCGFFLSVKVLPSIVAAVEGSGAEVYIDGGVSRGTDVFKVNTASLTGCLLCCSLSALAFCAPLFLLQHPTLTASLISSFSLTCICCAVSGLGGEGSIPRAPAAVESKCRWRRRRASHAGANPCGAGVGHGTEWLQSVAGM